MKRTGTTSEIEELRREIALLPPGSITTKRISGKDYYYHRVSVGGKRTETYVEFCKVDKLRMQIERRKRLEAMLRELLRLQPAVSSVRTSPSVDPARSKAAKAAPATGPSGKRRHSSTAAAEAPAISDEQRLPASEASAVSGDRRLPASEASAVSGERRLPTSETSAAPDERRLPASETSAISSDRRLPASEASAISGDRRLPASAFRTSVRTGDRLANMASLAAQFRRRECYDTLRDYVFGKKQDKVFILYGLRRTGKTTLIRQAILEMTPGQLARTAFIQISWSNTLSDVNADLRTLEENGFEYIFIDEVTLLKDFIEGAALFSDIYAASGMKIVLSGTDSLGFVFAGQDQLYGRCIMLHTTFIPYREFENVLGIRGIDEFIRYGGTMSMGGSDYNGNPAFANKKTANEYINSSIAHNIQHSLEFYQDGGHFRLLYDLYRKDELTSAINRVVEDMNHRFTKDVLTRAFRSSDLSVTARNLMKDRKSPFDLESNIDREKVEISLRSMLDILEKDEQTVDVSDEHAAQIREYLALLDLVTDIGCVHLPVPGVAIPMQIFTQPGMRYAFAEALVDSLISDARFAGLDISIRQSIERRLLDTVRGFIMEEIVLLETKAALPQNQVFRVQFAVGEFDMVVCDSSDMTCSIYEIKHSTELIPDQYRYLIDDEKCAAAEHRFGRITGRYVIYRGAPAESDGVRYLNVEDYLKGLGERQKTP